MKSRLTFSRRQLSARHSKAVALVITLLMLSAITFLTVAFLAVTKRDRDATVDTLDAADAKNMQEVAVARAQSEIIAHMQAHNDLLAYDLMSSHNFINPAGFDGSQTPGTVNSNNVNYDFLSSDGVTPLSLAQRNIMIANLFFDPRAPVYVQTNRAGSNDFRFWIDLNRNGLFETNGYHNVIADNGQFLDPNYNLTSTGPFLTNYFDGEPEWIGLLRDPSAPHSARNRFIGRYAYAVLPIGKTLDINYIHNHATNGADLTQDGFLRNQGFGSWELNLAAYLAALNTNIWNSNSAPYAYNNPSANSTATADALAILTNRYNGNLASLFSPNAFFNQTGPFNGAGFDAYSTGPQYFNTPQDYSSPAHATSPWAGSDSPKSYFNFLDEIFDPTKTSAFTTHLLNAVNAIGGYTPSSYNRYTFQRMLATLGSDSAPELQTQVFGDTFTPNINVVLTNVITRTKVNINFCNTNEIAKKLNNNPTNLAVWNANDFFMNAAELLLRSQVFTITNTHPSNAIVDVNYATFGVTNIPIYDSTNSGVRYTDHIHRMLQLAANIYDTAHYTNDTTTPRLFSFPSVFRPLCISSNLVGHTGVYIVGWEQITNYNTILNRQFLGLTNAVITTNDMVWGVPLVVGAKKGIPNLNAYNYLTTLGMTRKIVYTRLTTNDLPNNINQFYVMYVSNLFGVECWNSYKTSFTNQITFRITNEVSILLTNNFGYGTNLYLTNSQTLNPNPPLGPLNGKANANSYIIPLFTNVLTLPQSYFSEVSKKMIAFTNDSSFLDADLHQGTNVPPGWPEHKWTVHITNRLMYAMIDTDPARTGPPKILDFVNLADFGSTLNVTQEVLNVNLAQASKPFQFTTFSPRGANDTGGFSEGMSNQIAISKGQFAIDGWVAQSGETTSFADNLNPGPNKTNNGKLVFSAPFTPSIVIQHTATWQANDPLVHYTVGDLTSGKTTNLITFITPVSGAAAGVANQNLQFKQKNKRYDPWPSSESSGEADMTTKDPLIINSDAWSFPTNLFPSIGWLGRVHRGTPWQTMFMKADSQPNFQNWTNVWTSSIDSYPTNDYILYNLFTVSPNDNSSRGLLSINQTNHAAWAAALGGVIALTNNVNGTVIDPINAVMTMIGIPIGTSNTIPTNNINSLRASLTNGVFHSVGEILQAPAFTTESVYTGGTPQSAQNFRDEVVERIPQQILSLLKVGQPRFVIYAYGQSLKPGAVVTDAATPSLFNLCTNYSITGEFVTRTVCHVEGDVNKPRIVVDGFNVISGN